MFDIILITEKIVVHVQKTRDMQFFLIALHFVFFVGILM